jgi:hypothetical protein
MTATAPEGVAFRDRVSRIWVPTAVLFRRFSHPSSQFCCSGGLLHRSSFRHQETLQYKHLPVGCGLVSTCN